MKKLIGIVLALVMVSGCSQGNGQLAETTPQTPKKVTAKEVLDFLIDNGIEITEHIEYTADNDPNELLGKPNEYISKVNFTDSGSTYSLGCTIEVFDNNNDLKARQRYVESVWEAVPITKGRFYANDYIYVRFSRDVKESRANEYKLVLDDIFSGFGKTASSSTSESVNPKENDSQEQTIEQAVDMLKVTYEKYSDSFSDYAIIYVTNNSQLTVDYYVNVDFYSDGELVGTTSTGSEALEPNITYATYVMNDVKFDDIEYKISAQKSDYDGVVSNLSVDVKIMDSKAIISVTNNGDLTAKFVQYLSVFYNKGKIVGFDQGYTTDRNSQLLSGNTERAEADIYGSEFDDVKVYLNGRSEIVW